MERSSVDIQVVNSAASTQYCCVLGCNNNSENNPNSTFHSLPVMNQIKNTKNSGDEKSQFLSKQLKICDQHFKQNNVLSVLNNDPSSSFSMSLVMPSVNTKIPLHTQDFHDDSFILGPADIPLASGSTEEIIEEEVITTEEIEHQSEGIKYSVVIPPENFIDVKSEEYYDLENVCRICLTEQNLRNIDTDYIDNILIHDMLQTCVKLNSPVEDKLPNQICLTCVSDLKVMYDFVVRYNSTKTILETYITKQQDINERRFYLEHGYINQSVNISTDVMSTSETIASTSNIQKSTDPEEIKISNSINSLTKELIKGKSNIELDGKTYVLAKAFLCKTCNELLFVKESLDEHKCDAKKKPQGGKKTKTNLIIKQTDINRCNQCGKKFSNLMNHICDASQKSGIDYDEPPAQKCPKCKLIFKYFHKCEHDPQPVINKKLPLLLVKQNKKRKISSTS